MHRPGPFAALAALLGCVCLLVAVSGCGASVTTKGVPGHPASTARLLYLHAVRISRYDENTVAAFDKTSANTAGIAQLYDAIAALKPYPPGSYSCPGAPGAEYQLTFTRADGSTVGALATTSGCAWAGITDGATGTTPHGRIVDWHGFWSLFAGGLRRVDERFGLHHAVP